MLMLCVFFQGITVPIPSAFLPFIASTLSSSHTTSPTNTPTEGSTSTGSPTPSEPNIVAIVGAVIGIVVVLFIGVVAVICWRRRRRRPHNDTLTQGARLRGILGRLMEWRTGYTLGRADTVSSWFVGREEKDASRQGLLPKESLRVPPSQQSSNPKFGNTSRDASATSPSHLENQPTPPPPPPSYLKPLGSMGA